MKIVVGVGALVAVLALAAPVPAASLAEQSVRSGRRMTLMDSTDITAAVAGQTSTAITGLEGAKYIVLQGTFTYGSGGTTAKFWVQTSIDGGTTWRDIACFAFTTASLKKFAGLSVYISSAVIAAASDAALADDTALNGLIGDRIRVKYTTTGTYAGSTTAKIDAVIRR